MELVKKSLNKWIISLVVLAIGILCIVAAATSGRQASADAYQAISVIIGITLICISGLTILFAFLATIVTKGETSFGVGAISAALTLALGILFITDTALGGQLIWILLNYVPYVMLVVGAIFAIDAVIVFIYGFYKKNVKAAFYTAILEIIVAAITILLGALMVGNNPIISKEAQLIIFGIVLILYAVLLCITTILPVITVRNTIINVEANKVMDVDPAEENNEATENKAE